MRPAAHPFDRISHFVHARFLWLLLATYVLAAIGPGPGLAIRSVSLGRISLMGEAMSLTLPSLMLGFLLLNAGLGVRASELRDLAKRPAPLGLGLLANLVIPISYIFGVSLILAGWHNNARGPVHPGRAGPGGLDADRRVVDRLVAECRRRPRPEPRPGGRLDAPEPDRHPDGPARGRLHGGGGLCRGPPQAGHARVGDLPDRLRGRPVDRRDREPPGPGRGPAGRLATRT